MKWFSISFKLIQIAVVGGGDMWETILHMLLQSLRREKNAVHIVKNLCG